jgi:hypothetical protein
MVLNQKSTPKVALNPDMKKTFRNSCASLPLIKFLSSAMGLTKMAAIPDFAALYSGTPDSSWFVRKEDLIHVRICKN